MNKQLLDRVYPSSWEISPLSDFSSLTPNSFVDGPFGSDLKVSDYRKEGVRVLQLQNLGDGYFIDKNKIYTSKEKAEQLARCKLKPGDIIIAKMAEPLARATIVPAADPEYIIVADLIKLKIRDDVDPYYLVSFLNFSDFRNEAERLSTGTTRTRISLSALKKISLPKPPVDTQKKIAEILITIDQLIVKTQMLIDKHTAVKQGMMADLFTRGIDLTTGQLRPPVEQAPRLYEETELGFMPKDWHYAVLGKYIEKYLYGPRFDAGQYSLDGNVKTIRGTDFTKEGEILYDQVPIAEIPIAKIRHHILKSGDLVVITTADCGLTSVFEEKNYAYIPSAYAVKLKLNKDVLPYYIKAYMQTYFAKQQVNKYVRQGTLGNLPGSDILNFMIAVPSKLEQAEVIKKLTAVDNLLEKEKLYFEKLKIKKKGLMQDLLTGKVTV